MKAIIVKVVKNEKSNLYHGIISIEHKGFIDPRRWSITTTDELEEEQEIDISKIILTDIPVRYKSTTTGEWETSHNLFQTHIRF